MWIGLRIHIQPAAALTLQLPDVLRVTHTNISDWVRAYNCTATPAFRASVHHSDGISAHLRATRFLALFPFGSCYFRTLLVQPFPFIRVLWPLLTSRRSLLLPLSRSVGPPRVRTLTSFHNRRLYLSRFRLVTGLHVTLHACPPLRPETLPVRRSGDLLSLLAMWKRRGCQLCFWKNSALSL